MTVNALMEGDEAINAPLPRRHLVPLLIAPFAMALALALGYPTLRADFTSGDDQRFITEHFLVANASFENALQLLTIIHGDLYQPLPMLSFQANYAAADPMPDSRFGVSAWGFHLTNVLLHAVNAALAALLALRLSRRPAVAALAGLMFACHPFAVEAVAWVSGRMMLLGTFFALATLLLCLRDGAAEARTGGGRTRSPFARQWIITPFTWLASLLSKVLPTVPFAAAWLAFREKRMIERRDVVLYGALLLMAVAAAALAVHSSRAAGFVGEDGEFASSPVVSPVLAMGYYIENYVLPLRLSPWVPPAEGVTFESLLFWRAALEIAALVALAVWLRQRSPIAFAGIVLFALLIAPFLFTTAARRFLAADRYMYLPIFGLHLAVADLLVRLSDRLDRILMPSLRHRYLLLPAAVILAPWLMVGWNLSLAWSDTVARELRVAAVYPDHPLAHYELAKAYNFSGRPDRALDVIDRARERWPDHPRLAAQAGEAFRLQKDWAFAEKELAYAAKHMPGHTTTHYHLAMVLEQLGRRDEAAAKLADIVAARPGYLPAWTLLGRLRRAAGDEDGAIEAYARALEINADHRTALLELANLYIARNRAADAIPLLQRTLRNDPRDARARFALAVALVGVDRAADALPHYDLLIAGDEANVVMRLNRGAASAHVGALEKAEQDYLYVATERPEILEPFVALHELLVQQRRYDRNLELWQFRTERMGRTPENMACMVWAHMLAGDRASAEAAYGGLSEGSSGHALARWAFAYDALRRGDDAALAEVLDTIVRSTSEPTWPSQSDRIEWHGRIIQPALSGLSAEIRNTRAGRVTLACCLHYTGRRDVATELLEQIAREPEQDVWTERSRSYLKSVQ